MSAVAFESWPAVFEQTQLGEFLHQIIPGWVFHGTSDGIEKVVGEMFSSAVKVLADPAGVHGSTQDPAELFGEFLGS